MLKSVVLKKSIFRSWRSVFVIFPILFGFMCFSLITHGQNVQTSEPVSTHKPASGGVNSYSSSRLLAMNESDFAAAVSGKFILTDISPAVSIENRKEGVNYISFDDFMKASNEKKRIILESRAYYIIAENETSRVLHGQKTERVLPAPGSAIHFFGEGEKPSPSKTEDAPTSEKNEKISSK